MTSHKKIRIYSSFITSCSSCPAMLETEPKSNRYYCEKTGENYHKDMFDYNCPLPVSFDKNAFCEVSWSEKLMLTASKTVDYLHLNEVQNESESI